MLSRYFGLLFVGLTTAAQASEEKDDKVLFSEYGQTTTRVVGSGTGYLSANKLNNNNIVLNSTSVVVMADEAHGGSGTGHTSESLANTQPEKETALATGYRWSKNSDGYRFLKMARHKRIEFNTEKYKVTLHHEAAVFETGNIKVGLGSGSTSLTWSTAL